MTDKNIIGKKAITILINIAGLGSLLYFQSLRYQQLVNHEFEGAHSEVLRRVGIMQATGNDLNWIIGVCFILLVVNLLLYRNWVRAKRWILEPVFILFISLGLAITYHIDRVAKTLIPHKTKGQNKSGKWKRRQLFKTN